MINFIFLRNDQNEINPHYRFHYYESCNYLKKEYELLLKSIGKIHYVDSAEQVDLIFNKCKKINIKCYCFIFFQPDKLLLNVRCPIIWVHSNISINLSRNTWYQKDEDWKQLFRKINGLITSSKMTENCVKSLMGYDYKLSVIPVPITQHLDVTFQCSKRNPVNNDLNLFFNSPVFDSSNLNLKPHQLPRDNNFSSVQSQTLNLHKKVVFFAKFNPLDEMSNWRDLVSAYCWCFRSAQDTLLVLKTPLIQSSEFTREFVLYLSRLKPYCCQIVWIQNDIDNVTYAKLLSASAFYVNTYNADAYGIHTLEFLSYGIPVITPCHTALHDFICDKYALIVDSHLQLSPCLDDPKQALLNANYRINWESLCLAFKNGYKVIKENLEQYQQLCESAKTHIHQYSNSEQIRKKLKDFFNVSLEKGMP